MSDSSSYSSLLALVDSHLSKVNIQSSHLETGHNTGDKVIQINNTTSDGSLLDAGKRLAIPSFNLSGDLVKNVLAKQVSNMLKAKQTNEKLQKLSEESKREPQNEHIHLSDEHETDCNVIDLMKVLRTPFKTAVKCDSRSSSTESLFEPTFIEFDDESNGEIQLSEESLKCHTDLSYILDFKVPQAKCSTFGKVLVSRFRPFTLPYKRKSFLNSVQKFDFKSKSPCDILKDKSVHK